MDFVLRSSICECQAVDKRVLIHLMIKTPTNTPCRESANSGVVPHHPDAELK